MNGEEELRLRRAMEVGRYPGRDMAKLAGQHASMRSMDPGSVARSPFQIDALESIEVDDADQHRWDLEQLQRERAVGRGQGLPPVEPEYTPLSGGRAVGGGDNRMLVQGVQGLGLDPSNFSLDDLIRAYKQGQ